MVRVAFLRRRRLTAPGPQADSAWQALLTLGEPRRREVYETVAAHDGPVTRDEVAAALGMGRSLAAFHLDKLADTGLLEVSFARSPDRPAGRGGGRPSKRYQVSDLDLGISVPPRRYDLVGRVLARTLGRASRHGDPAEEAWDVAREEGRRLAEAAGSRSGGSRPDVERVVADLGFAPVREDGRLRLRNCPFHSVADAAPGLVCTLNHGLLTGLLEGLYDGSGPAGGGTDGGPSARRVDPRPGGCCVEIQAAAS
jgi:predicted ArsR family transcriptional regulator